MEHTLTMDVLNGICEQRSQKLILRGSVILDRPDVKEEQARYVVISENH